MEFVDAYLHALERHGSLAPRAVRPLHDESALDALRALPGVDAPAEVLAWFRRVDGYDPRALATFGLFEPQLAWGMFALPLEECLSHHEICDEFEDANYWPKGFLPLLWDGSGGYLVVNCRAASPTRGAVYDMSEGVGCNRVSASLPEFLRASAAEIDEGLRRYERDASSLAVGGREYLERAAVIFGHTPYFARPGRMGEQIVDWV